MSEEAYLNINPYTFLILGVPPYWWETKLNFKAMLRYNEAIGQNEWIQKGKLISDPNSEAVLTTKKKDKDGNLLGEEEQKDFRLVDVQITYDDGSTDVVQSTMWEKQVEANIFKQDDEVEIAIQTEGAYAGRSKVQLPAVKVVDLSRLAGAIEAMKKAKAGQPESAVNFGG